MTDDDTRMSVKNIILFGQTGAGKSSVVNLMAGHEVAQTSAGTERCTLRWEEFSLTFNKYTYKVFDTIGMEEYQLGLEEYLDAIVNAYTLIEKLRKEGGIHLLLFCIRAGRFTSTIQNNYRLFYECLCQKEVPIVLVVTGLETEQRMEDWWDKYKSTFDKRGIKVDDHVCITAASGLIGKHKELYEQSRQLVYNAVVNLTNNRKVERDKRDGWDGGEGWFERFISMLREFLGQTTLKQKQIATVLTKRCGMPREAAVQLAKKVRPKLESST